MAEKRDSWLVRLMKGVFAVVAFAVVAGGIVEVASSEIATGLADPLTPSAPDPGFGLADGRTPSFGIEITPIGKSF